MRSFALFSDAPRTTEVSRDHLRVTKRRGKPGDSPDIAAGITKSQPAIASTDTAEPQQQTMEFGPWPLARCGDIMEVGEEGGESEEQSDPDNEVSSSEAAPKAAAEAAPKAAAKAAPKAAAAAATAATAKAAPKAAAAATAATAKAALKAAAAAAEAATTAASAPVTTYIDHPTFIYDKPKCGRCQLHLDLDKSQLTRKTKGSWRCNKCNLKAVQASQHGLGHMINTCLTNLDPEETTKFWQDVNATKSAHKLKDFIDNTIESSHAAGKITTDGGTYQPLRYYQKLGYNSKRIKRLCTDTRDHPILGMTYKVDLIEVKRRREEWVKRNRTIGAHEAADDAPMKKKKRKRLAKQDSATTAADDEASGANDADPPKKKAKTSADSSDESASKKQKKKKKHSKKASKKTQRSHKKSKKKRDSSSTSSSESSGAKRKREKEEEKAKQVAEKSKAAERKKQVKTAYIILSKLGLVEQAHALAKTKGIQKVPQWAQDQLNETLLKVTEVYKNAKKVTVNEATTLVSSVDEVTCGMLWCIYVLPPRRFRSLLFQRFRSLLFQRVRSLLFQRF